MNNRVFAFYTAQSKFTDLGPYTSMIRGLSDNIDDICKSTRNVIEHYHGLNSHRIKPLRFLDIDIRNNVDILAHIEKRSYKNIYEDIPFEDKVVGTCRTQAVFTCGILRAKQIPARVRYMFCTYFIENFNHEQTVVEYWCKERKRWIVVDSAMNYAVLKAKDILIDFDLHDVPTDKSMPASQAWLACRYSGKSAESFGAYMKDNKRCGQGYIRLKLYHDLACLNKIEVMEWDRWGTTLDNNFFAQNEEEQCDYLARILNIPNLNDEGIYDKISNLSEYVIPRKVLSKSPFKGDYEFLF